MPAQANARAALTLAALLAAPLAVSGAMAADETPRASGAPVQLVPPAATPAPEQPPPAARLPVEEPSPNFQAIRPAEDAQPQPAPAPQQAAPVPPPAPAPAAPTPTTSPAPVAEAAPPAPPPAAQPSVIYLAVGGALAGLFGLVAGAISRGSEARARRRAADATLALELETRSAAYEAVPVPPNAEAGVSFVSAVIALANIDNGWKGAQANLHLLQPKLAAHVSVHYAAVTRVADFVKGQSLAAAVRMLQANRIGGHPCPDAGTMSQAHAELGAAFRGVDKLIAQLKAKT